MLRKFLFVSLAVITLASCKKDKDEAPAYHLSAKVDGEKKDFNTSVAATKQNFGGYFFVIINGIAGSASSPYPAFSLTITDDAAITAKTYTATNFEAGGSYIKTNQESYESDTDFSVNITSVTATEVKGTFTGKVEDGATIKTVTEGTFSAKFQ